MRLFAILGNTPILSQAELENLVQTKLSPLTPHLVALPDLSDEEIPALAAQLGGTVKLLREVAILSNSEDDQLITALVDHLTSQSDQKITFALSQLSEASSMPISSTELKDALKEKGTGSRYLTSSQHSLGTQISAAAWDQNPRLQEFFLVREDEHYVLLKTIWVQTLNDWAERDRGKPYADRKKGMLPPKVARIMLNLLTIRPTDNPVLIYDPFVGSGTVLMEAAMLGYQVMGSDLDATAVQGSGQNLQWLAETYPELDLSPTLLKHDVTQPLPTNLPKVDAIVTEPFLGKPRPDFKRVPNIMKGLEKLYTGAFKKWATILKPGGEVVVILPAIETPKQEFTFEKLIDKLETFGYSTTLGPIEYSRPQARVKRQIYRFKFQPGQRKG